MNLDLDTTFEKMGSMLENFLGSWRFVILLKLIYALNEI